MTTRRHLLLIIAVLLAACSNDSSDDPRNDTTPASAEDGQIRFNADVWQVLPGTARRAATFDNVAALRSEGSFRCAAYNAGTLTTYIPETTVDWKSETSQWAFNNGDSHYYWPLPTTNGGTYPSLDFFGYMPVSPSNISSISYTPATRNVTFTCSSLPMNNAGQGSSLKEFMFGVATDRNYTNSAAGVPLTFQHPFARIKLQLAASHPDVTIRSITLKGIKNNGDYDLSADPQWTATGAATDFVLTLNADYNGNPAEEQQIGDYYIMIPQEWGGEIEVNADCLFWGEKTNYPSLTTTVATNWQPGYSYTYTLNISPDDLRVDTEKFTEQW